MQSPKSFILKDLNEAKEIWSDIKNQVQKQ
jgi:hypothetical protein